MQATKSLSATWVTCAVLLRTGSKGFGRAGTSPELAPAAELRSSCPEAYAPSLPTSETKWTLMTVSLEAFWHNTGTPCKASSFHDWCLEYKIKLLHSAKLIYVNQKVSH